MYRRFQVGQVIRLRSGGPKMIVRTLDENALGEPMVDCVWIDNDGQERTGRYPETGLESAEV